MTSVRERRTGRALARLRRSRWFGWVRHVSLLVVTILLVEYVVLPQVVEARRDLTLLASATSVVLVVALALEVSSLMSYSALSRMALDPRGRPSYGTLLCVDLTGLGLSHVVPGGGATAVALRLRLLASEGVHPANAATSLDIQTVASIVMLTGTFVLGLAMALPRFGGHPDFQVAGAVAFVALVGLVLTLSSLVRTTERTMSVVQACVRRVPLLRAAGPQRAFHSAAQHLRTLAADPGLLRRTAAFALGNWLLDAACLWLCLRAYGYDAPVGPLLAVYAAANLVALLPITPGGLGIVEGLLVPLLISFGADGGVALVGVLTWRLLEYWLPIPVSAVTYLWLRAGHARPRQTPRKPASAAR